MKQIRNFVAVKQVIAEKYATFSRDELVDLINKAHDSVKGHTGRIVFEVEYDEDWAPYSTHATHLAQLIMTYSRMENDQEYAERTDKENKRKTEQEARDLAELERLKRLYDK